jgi:hypothetical protein
MAATSKFGLGPYGAGAYSRVVVRERIAVSATSLVTVFAEVRRHAGLIAINAGASVTVSARLLWERIPVQSCEGRWLPLVSSPCRRAA